MKFSFYPNFANSLFIQMCPLTWQTHFSIWIFSNNYALLLKLLIFIDFNKNERARAALKPNHQKDKAKIAVKKMFLQ